MRFPVWSKVFLQNIPVKIWAQFLSTHTDSTVQKYIWVQLLVNPGAFIKDLSN